MNESPDEVFDRICREWQNAADNLQASLLVVDDDARAATLTVMNKETTATMRYRAERTNSELVVTMEVWLNGERDMRFSAVVLHAPTWEMFTEHANHFGQTVFMQMVEVFGS